MLSALDIIGKKVNILLHSTSVLGGKRKMTLEYLERSKKSTVVGLEPRNQIVKSHAAPPTSLTTKRVFFSAYVKSLFAAKFLNAAITKKMLLHDSDDSGKHSEKNISQWLATTLFSHLPQPTR